MMTFDKAINLLKNIPSFLNEETLFEYIEGINISRKEFSDRI